MIDREKIIEILEKAKAVIEDWVPMFEQYNTPAGIDVAVAMLKEQEQIVRCKDCRYLNEDSGICIIGIMHGYRDTWFCAYGERR